MTCSYLLRDQHVQEVTLTTLSAVSIALEEGFKQVQLAPFYHITQS